MYILAQYECLENFVEKKTKKKREYSKFLILRRRMIEFNKRNIN